MFPAIRTSALLALVGACVLLASGLGLALEGAGPYGSLPAVRFGVATGAASAYFIVLWAASCASRWVRISPTSHRNTVTGLLSIAAGVATFLAPLIASASLTAVCQSEALCPQAANPILWSYLNLVTGLPVPPVLVGIAVVLVSAVILGQRKAPNAG